MNLCDAFAVSDDLTCFVGSGGKTTAIETVARYLAEAGNDVVITTTTHMGFPKDFPLVTDERPAEICRALEAHGAVYVGKPVDDHKIGLLASLEELTSIASYVLCEADGSARLPLKVHNATEPVVPGWCSNTVCVVGASGIGQPVGKVMHRAALRFSDLEQPATPKLVADVLMDEMQGAKIFINQADTHPAEARALGQALLEREFSGEIFMGSAQADEAEEVW